MNINQCFYKLCLFEFLLFPSDNIPKTLPWKSANDQTHLKILMSLLATQT